MRCSGVTRGTPLEGLGLPLAFPTRRGVSSRPGKKSAGGKRGKTRTFRLVAGLELRGGQARAGVRLGTGVGARVPKAKDAQCQAGPSTEASPGCLAPSLSFESLSFR